MSASVSDIQQRLDGLSPSDQNYRRLLSALLTHEDLRPYIYSLERSGLRGFVELLDGALNHIPVTDDLFRKTLRRLQSTCSNREVLPESYLIPSEKLSDRGMPISAGDFADTFQAKFDGKKVCIKTLRSYVQDTGGVINKIFYGEVVVRKWLQHPNIVPFLGVPTKMPPPFEFVCEWMENVTISEYVIKHTQVDRIELLWDVADGLHYLHSCGIIHGNLKGANVLVDKNGHARLTGFELTSIGRGGNSARTPHDLRVAGMTTWAAPEILRGGAITKEGDVFTFAMVAVETYTGHSPFVTAYQSALYDIMSGKRPERPGVLSNDRLWELIQRCWDEDPGKRLTALEMLEFFQASFPGGREIPKAREFPSAPSAWTLKDPDAHMGGGGVPRQNLHGRNTQDVGEPGFRDLSAGDQVRVGGPEPPTSGDGHTSGAGMGNRAISIPPLAAQKQGAQFVDEIPVGGDRPALDDPVDLPPAFFTADPPKKGDPTPSNPLGELWKGFRAKFAALKVIPRDRLLNGRKPAKSERDGRGFEVRKGLLPILDALRRR